MSLSTSLRKVASNVITKFGVEVTFSQETSTSFAPATGIDTVTTATFTGYGVKDKYKKDEVDGKNVLNSDIKLIFEFTDTVPKIGDTCTIGSISYRVMNVTIIDPADITIIYEIQLRI